MPPTWCDIRHRYSEYEQHRIDFLEACQLVNQTENRIRQVKGDIIQLRREGEDVTALQQQLEELTQNNIGYTLTRNGHRLLHDNSKTVLRNLMRSFQYGQIITLTDEAAVGALSKAREWLRAGRRIRYKMGKVSGRKVAAILRLLRNHNLPEPHQQGAAMFSEVLEIVTAGPP